MAAARRNTGEGDDGFVARLLLIEEIGAERLIAWVRIIAALGVGVTFLVTIETFEWLGLIEPPPRPAPHGGPSIAVRGLVWLFLLFGTGMMALWLARPGRWRSWMPFLFTALDAAILIFGILRPLTRHDLPGSFAVLAPALFAVPVAFALGSLRPRPSVQLTFVGLFAAGLVGALIAHGMSLDPPTPQQAAEAARFFDIQSNFIRFLTLIAAGLTIAVGVARSRRLLRRSIEENQRRKALTRFLPAEIAPQITGSRTDLLRRGERRVVTILFADIRDSTAMGETMDPMRLSVFISSFRRRVLRAAGRHRGVVDKFIGDGAMVLFGLDEREGAAAEAIGAARDLLDYIARWNDKRKFNPPVRIGIGIHTGEAYVGVIGSEERLEFTVLGDAVNIAARLEDLTKRVGAPLLVSAATLAEAGADEGWTLVDETPLRGRSGELAYYARGEAGVPRPASPPLRVA